MSHPAIFDRMTLFFCPFNLAGAYSEQSAQHVLGSSCPHSSFIHSIQSCKMCHPSPHLLSQTSTVLWWHRTSWHTLKRLAVPVPLDFVYPFGIRQDLSCSDHSLTCVNLCPHLHQPRHALRPRAASLNLPLSVSAVLSAIKKTASTSSH